jgi:nucleoside-diphosphate-sugar epimerase
VVEGDSVVVLGGSGFVGRHICAALARDGWDVTVVSREPASAAAGVRAIAMDLLAEGCTSLARLLIDEKPELVVNATGAVWRATDWQMWQTNGLMVEGVIEAVARLPWRPRLVHIGTVYEYTPELAGVAINSRTRQRPVGIYGQTKLFGSSLVLQATQEGRIDGTVLRLTTVIGPGSPPDSLLGRVAEQLSRQRAATGGFVVKLGALTGEHDFVDATDAANAVALAARRPVVGEVINIGRGETVAVRSMVEMLISASGLPAVIEETTPPAQTHRPRGPESRWLRVDPAEAVRLLGWRPEVPLERSLRALWEEVSAR